MPDLIGLGNGLIDVVLLLVILVVLVVIHELGHFIVARRAGVTVHEFGIGFPPRAKVLGTRQAGHHLHAELAAHRRLRAAGRGGGRVGRPARLRPPATADAPGDPARRRGHERAAGIRAADSDRGASPIRAQPFTGAERPGRLAGRSGRACSGGQQVGTTTDSEGNVIPIYDDSGDLILAVDGRRFAVVRPARRTAWRCTTYVRAATGDVRSR